MSSEKSSSSSKRDPSVEVVLRNLAVYRMHRYMIRLALLATPLAIIALLVALFFIQQKVPPQYVQASADGKMIQSVPLNKPNMDQAGVLDFARQAITELNQYDYINYKKQIPQAQPYFTPYGWNNYLTQLKQRDTLKTVETQRDIVTVDFTGPANIAKTTVLDLGGGRQQYVWVIEQPITVNYIGHGAGGTISGLRQQGVVQMVIVRVPYTDSDRGLAIQVYNFMENNTNNPNP